MKERECISLDRKAYQNWTYMKITLKNNTVQWNALDVILILTFMESYLLVMF